MPELPQLAHTLANAWQRAALCRDMGEHGLADYWDHRADEAQREIERLDRLMVKECGVS